MCGIAGYFGKLDTKKIFLQEASKVLQHRGPDGEGFYTHQNNNHNLAFVHTRLAIIDINQRSNQPFHYQDTVLIFNGEIYNYIEIKKELEKLGHYFKTNSDTEVLIHALCQWDIKALNKLEGMWSFAWYNKKKGELYLCRDRFGEKPFYLWKNNSGLYFSSEIKGIAALAGEWPKINQNHILRGLVNGYKSLYKTKETYFQDVEELPSGSYIIIDKNDKIFHQKFWEPKPRFNKKLTFNDSVALTKEAVIRAVKLRMRSDVPLAFCMSGGIDSNTLISIASKILNCDVHGFTIINKDKRYEEKSLVDHMVKTLGIKHTAINLDKENFLENLYSLIKTHDAPVHTISYYLHWQLMKAMSKNGYKVSISGTAADELFTGYYDHHNLYLYEIFNNKKLYKKSLINWEKYQKRMVRNPHLKNDMLYINNPNFREHIFLNNDLFASWLNNVWEEPFTETNFVPDLLRNRMLNEMFVEAVPVILHEDDLNAMSFSIENRSPFLDKELFDLAYSIPTQHLIQNGRAKSVLRSAMKNIVPNIILNERRKVGFNAPILDLLDINNKKTIDYLLDDSPVYDLVKKRKIEELVKNNRLPNSSSKFLFNFLNVKMFMEIQKEKR